MDTTLNTQSENNTLSLSGALHLAPLPRQHHPAPDATLSPPLPVQAVAADPSGAEGEGYGPAVHRTEQHYPVLHPKQLERNVMLVTKVDELYAAKVRVRVCVCRGEVRLGPAMRGPAGMRQRVRVCSGCVRGRSNEAQRGMAFSQQACCGSGLDAQGHKRDGVEVFEAQSEQGSHHDDHPK